MACPGMYHTTPAPTPHYTGHMYTVSDGRDGSIARVNPKPYILNPNPYSVMNHTTQAPTRSITSFIRTHSTRDCHSITTHSRIRREVGRRGVLTHLERHRQTRAVPSESTFKTPNGRDPHCILQKKIQVHSNCRCI